MTTRDLAAITADRALIEAEVNAAHPNIPQDLQTRYEAILGEYIDYVDPELQARLDASIPARRKAATPTIVPVKLADAFDRPFNARFAGVDVVTGRPFVAGAKVWRCLWAGAGGIANDTRGYVTELTMQMARETRDAVRGSLTGYEVTPVKGNTAAIRELLASAPVDTQIRVRWATSEILYRRVADGWRRQGRNGSVSVAQLGALVDGALFIRATARDGSVIA